LRAKSCHCAIVSPRPLIPNLNLRVVIYLTSGYCARKSREASHESGADLTHVVLLSINLAPLPGGSRNRRCLEGWFLEVTGRLGDWEARHGGQEWIVLLPASDKMRRWALGAHAAYFVLTGVWPLLHIRSFMAVTGPKRDIWLVKTLGALVTAIGVILLRSSLTRAARRESELVALATSASLGGCDVYYALKRDVSPVYLLDGAIDLVLAAYWAMAPRGEDAAAIDTSRG
jgi:hypothetical protein